jgi:hypothetical protein
MIRALCRLTVTMVEWRSALATGSAAGGPARSLPGLNSAVDSVDAGSAALVRLRSRMVAIAGTSSAGCSL